MKSELNWDDLRIFLSVARSESLSGAARRLKCDPATLGRRIERLEVALGASLFSKSPQGYDLTSAGQKLLGHAEAAEQAAIGASDAVGTRGSGLEGTVRIGAPDGCANFLLPQVIARIREKHAGLDIQIVGLPKVIDLSKREADMAITVSRPTAGRLLAQKISDYRLSLAASEDWLRARPPIRTIEDLRAYPLVGYIPDMIFDKELDYLDGVGLPPPRLASNSAAVQLRLIAEGTGPGIVHDFALPTVPTVRRVLPDLVTLSRTFWLVRHADDRKVARLARIAGLLVEDLRREIVALEALT